jgi:putative endopeptidase
MKKSLIVIMSMLAAAACAPKAGDPALDLTSLDPSTSPKVDFYQYSTGGWQEKNPLKPEYSRFGSFDAISERTRENLNALFENMTTMEAEKGSVEQKISDLYKMALDSTTRNSLGAEPIQKYIAEIQEVSTRDELATLLGKMNLYGEGGFFGAGVEADLANSDMQVLYLGQGGLGMHDRDYYLKEENKELYEGYKAFLVKVLELAGIPDAPKVVENDLAVENALAEASWSREQNRDMQAIYNPMSSAQIDKKWPGLRFGKVCKAAGIEPQEKVIVEQPSYFDALSKLMEKKDLKVLKDYLLCQFISGQCGALDDEFYTASWEFFSHQMAGTTEQQPRWKRAMSVPNSLLGEAVGEMYVDRYFPESSKQKMVALVENLRTALGEHIDALEWMSDETKARAREKLAAFTVKIGYPDKWKDYSTLDIDPEKTYYENLRSASAWYVQDNLQKLGKPTDKTEWGMTPQTVNAYYNPTTNEICFPAAILQPPFFDPNADDAVNYGAIGGVIGHEMSHGFDDQGSQFDKTGNQHNWWTEQDKKNYDQRTKVLEDFFSTVEAVPGKNINGKQTLGENIGDNGGLNVAFRALKNAMQENPLGVIDGFTPEQRFFLSWARVWASNMRPEYVEYLITVDTHSPNQARVNAALPHIDAWYDAFKVKKGDKLFIPKKKRAQIW